MIALISKLFNLPQILMTSKYLFMSLFNKYLLNAYYVPSIKCRLWKHGNEQFKNVPFLIELTL